ncbi:MAG: hypothetical protein GH151_00550 [Bacteroidetes bacterium]|nr:hypothetical protein [Bacteroidota bacterium]
MEKNKISNFLTPDISYLLGLITGRGEIQYTKDVKKIIIDFEYKSMTAKALTKAFDQKLHIQTSLDPVIIRLQNMGINTQKVVSDKKISIALKWEQEDISWLFIKYLINDTRFSYHDFEIPSTIFEATDVNKKEFLRGIADVTGYVRYSNYQQFASNLPKRYRVYIEISNRNWLLPAQICQLQQGLGVATQTINYGHPNLRDPKNKKGGTFWAKEHQIKIFAEDFDTIGFYISHKNEALRELADNNKKNFIDRQLLCDGTISRRTTKPSHPDEKHSKLPKVIKEKHFDSFKEICKCAGCYLQT